MFDNPVKRFWGRTGYLEIEGFDSPLVGLDFKFDIEKTGSIYNSFKASILGLSASHIQNLTIWKTPQSLQEQRRIKCYAGYETIGNKKLFDGFILDSAPTPPPDMWLNITGMIRVPEVKMIENPREIEGTRLGIFNEVCKELGLEGRWSCKKSDGSEKAVFKIEGKNLDLISKMAASFNIIVYEDDDTIIAIDNDRNTIHPDDGDIQIVDVDHGLISIASVDFLGANIKMRLNDSFGLYSWIELRSQLMPRANGIYMVKTKHHVGHMRGDDWYTELVTVRKDF